MPGASDSDAGLIALFEQAAGGGGDQGARGEWEMSEEQEPEGFTDQVGELANAAKDSGHTRAEVVGAFRLVARTIEASYSINLVNAMRKAAKKEKGQ